MNILLVSRSIPLHHFGGMELVAWDLAVMFAKMGHSVNFLTTSIPQKPSVLVNYGVTIHALVDTKPGKYSSAWWRESAKYFNKELKSQTDVVLSVSAGAFGLFDSKGNIPFVLQAHGTSLGEFLSKLREKKIKSYVKSLFNLLSLRKDLQAYQHFDAFVAVGEAVLRDTQKFPINRFLKESKVHLIKNGINTSIFAYNPETRSALRKKYHIDDSTKVVISASRLHKQKGVHLGLLGFAEYLKTHPNSIYMIIGDGPEYNNLKSMARDLKVENNVIFTGALEREELADYLSLADLFLFTSLRNEGLPLNVLEALSSGLKVIVSFHLKGVIDINREAVVSVDPKSEKEVAKALETDGNKGRRSYLPNEYSLEYCANKYIQLFNSLIAKDNNQC